MRVLLTTLNAKYIHSSLALRNLKAYCLPDITDIAVTEYTINNTLLDILADIYSERPEVVGFACYIWNLEMTLKLADLVKKVLPEVKIILGGPEVSYEPFSILGTHNYIDYIVLGEGEETLKQLLTSLGGSCNLDSITGLAFRRTDIDVVKGCAQVVDNLNSIPFAYSEADMDELEDRIIYYESSRGCPFSCQYCLSSATAGVRYYSLERVFRELKFFVDHDVKQVKFVDRTFNADKKHYLPILKFLAEQECRTNFHFEIAADLLDDEVLAFLQTVPKGRFQFEVGIQSTYNQTLNEIRRKNDWPHIVKAVSQVLSYGNIHVHLDLIVGLPYEDIDRFGQSFNDVFHLQPDMLQIGFLKLLKGSGVRKRAEQHNYVHMDTPPYEVLANRYISYGEIRELKLLEDIFNFLYNSGRFRHVLLFLIQTKYNDDAFKLFRSLTLYWEEKNLHRMAHSAKSLFKQLKEFCEQVFDDEKLTIGLELLKFDALMNDHGNIRPECLPWNGDCWNQETSAFWRNEAVVTKYLGQYRFGTWREIKKNYHIEIFEAELPNYLNLSSDKEGKSVVLFDYTQADTQYFEIQPDDFWITGGEFDAL